MAIQLLQQPGSVSFASDPIIVKAKTTLTGKTFLRIKMECTAEAFHSGEGIYYTENYSYEVDSDGTATFNISGTVATAIARCMEQEVEGTDVKQTVYSARITINLWEVFIDGMTEIEQGDTTSTGYTAITGSLTEFERLTADNADTATIIGEGRILSRKPEGEAIPKGIDLYMPAVISTGDTVAYSVEQGETKRNYSIYTGGALVPISLRIPTDELEYGTFKAGIAAEAGKGKYAVPSTPDMRNFLFLNGFGLIESATAVTKESLSYETESEQFVVPSEIGFRSHTRIASYAQQPFVTIEMSSGYVNREWAEWWINEFCTTRKAWMMADGRFLPVAIIPEDTVDLYDRSKPDLLAVNFTVRCSFAGGTYNSFVKRNERGK